VNQTGNIGRGPSITWALGSQEFAAAGTVGGGTNSSGKSGRIWDGKSAGEKKGRGKNRLAGNLRGAPWKQATVRFFPGAAMG